LVCQSVILVGIIILGNYNNIHAVDVVEQIMQGAAFLYRVQALKMQGVEFEVGVENFVLEDGKVLV